MYVYTDHLYRLNHFIEPINNKLVLKLINPALAFANGNVVCNRLHVHLNLSEFQYPYQYPKNTIVCSNVCIAK